MSEPEFGPIDGVHVQALHIVRNERGHLQEIARHDDEWLPGFGQIYVTATTPGTIKGWYRHRDQTDTLTVVGGRIRLALFDDRDGSSTRGATQMIDMGMDEPLLVVIPPSIWHCFRSIDDSPALIVHVNTVAFQFEDPDEERRSPEDPEMPKVWDRI